MNVMNGRFRHCVEAVVERASHDFFVVFHVKASVDYRVFTNHFLSHSEKFLLGFGILFVVLHLMANLI
jgi:hypothetical protein